MSAQWPSAVSSAANLYTTVNLLTTTLAGNINSAVTTIALASTTGFSTAGATTIDNEVIFYTGISGSNLTGCTRGADGTTAASHNSGVPVGATIVAYHVNAGNAEIIAIEQNLSDRFGLGTDIVVPAARAFTLQATSNQAILGTTRTVTITAPTPATSSRVVTIPDLVGDYSLVGTIGTQTIGGSKTFSSAVTINPVTNQIILGATRTVTVTAPTPASLSRVVTIPDLTGDYDFVGTIGTQTIGGAKTFSTAVAISPVTNQLVLGATRTVTVTAPTPGTTSRVWTIPDITADGTFAALEGTQTFSGAKTFSTDVTISGNHGLIIKDAAGTPKTVTLITPAALTSTYTLTLPVDAGSSNQYLTTNGSGVTSWTNAVGTGTVNSGTQYQLGFYATSTNAISGNSGIVTDASNNFAVSRSAAGADVTATIENTENVSGTSRAKLLIQVGGTSGGDAFVQYRVPGGSTWSVGLDNSATDNFVFSLSTSIGSSNVLECRSSGDVVVPLSDLYVSRSTSGGTVFMQIENGSNTASSHAKLLMTGGGSSGGNPYMQFHTPSGTIVDWSVGQDNAASGNFKISKSSNVGTSDAVTIDTSLNVSIGNTHLQIGGNQVYPIVQIVNQADATNTNTTSTTYVDTGSTITITPKFSTSKILIMVSGGLGLTPTSTANFARMQVLRGATQIGSNETSVNGINGVFPVGFSYYDSPATTSATTYKVQIKTTNAATTAYWGSDGAGHYQVPCSMTAIEIAQ